MNWNNSKNNQNNCDFCHESSIHDFIFMCFMVGNDFLPHIPSLEIIRHGIDHMIDVYKNVGMSYGHLTHKIDDNVIFRQSSFEVFMGTIQQYDKEILEEKLSHKDEYFPDLLLEKNAKIEDGKYTLDMDNYRKDYYVKYFGDDINQKQLCHEYLVGMQWVLSYYTRGVPNYKWCFKHHYAPFALELATHVVDFKFPDKVKTTPTTPFQQLLCVLPPKSRGLIPVPLSQLLTDSISKIKPFCPDEFEIDFSGKRAKWEGIVLLPMVDFSVVEEEYFKHIDKVAEKDIVRNTLGDSFLYKYSKNTTKIFKSYYGTINECHIKVKQIDI